MTEYAEPLRGPARRHRLIAAAAFWVCFAASGEVYRFARDHAPCLEFGWLNGDVLAALSRLLAGPTILTMGLVVFMLPTALATLKSGRYPPPGVRLLGPVKVVHGAWARFIAWRTILGVAVGVAITVYLMIDRYQFTQMLRKSGNWPQC